MNSPDLAVGPELAECELRRNIVSELFHVISQPLTGLHCLLEISLMKKQKAEDYRRDIQKAIEATNRLVESLRQARELAEADDPGELRKVDLSATAREVMAEFEPLLEATHVKARLSLAPELTVKAEPEKLRRAIFYVVDNVLHDLPLGSELIVSTELDSTAIFYIGASAREPSFTFPESEIEEARPVTISRRRIEAIGGRLRRSEAREGRSYWIELPLASD